MLSESYLLAWLRAFAFTQLIEVPIYVWLLPTSRSRAFVASAITHPWVWFAFPLLAHSHVGTGYVRFAMPSLPYASWAAYAELFAWAIEALWSMQVASWRRAVTVSFIANFASLTLGVVCRRLTGYP